MRSKTLIVVSALSILFLAKPLFAHDSVTVVTELSPPHQTFENGQIAGTSTNIVRHVLEASKVDAEFKIYPWARAFNIAKSKPNTLIYNIARTPEREKLFHWIGQVASYQFGFVKLSSREDISIQSIEQAKQYTIAVQRDDVSSNWLFENGFSEHMHKIITADIASSWDLLIKGKVDLIIDDPNLFETMQTKLGLKEKAVTLAYPITALNQSTWLAINIHSSEDLVARLMKAFQEEYK
jgi:polar amino acid transport system substrate-binding protein